MHHNPETQIHSDRGIISFPAIFRNCPDTHFPNFPNPFVSVHALSCIRHGLQERILLAPDASAGFGAAGVDPHLAHGGAEADGDVLDGAAKARHGVPLEMGQHQIGIIVGKVTAHIIHVDADSALDGDLHAALLIQDVQLGYFREAVILCLLPVHGGGGAAAAIGGIAFHDGAIHQMHEIRDQLRPQVIAAGAFAGGHLDAHPAGQFYAQTVLETGEVLPCEQLGDQAMKILEAGGIKPNEQEQIMQAPRGQAFTVLSASSRSTFQVEVPPSIVDMFQEKEYTSHYFVGEEGAYNWESYVAESRAEHELAVAANKAAEEKVAQNKPQKSSVTFNILTDEELNERVSSVQSIMAEEKAGKEALADFTAAEGTNPDEKLPDLADIDLFDDDISDEDFDALIAKKAAERKASGSEAFAAAGAASADIANSAIAAAAESAAMAVSAAAGSAEAKMEEGITAAEMTGAIAGAAVKAAAVETAPSSANPGVRVIGETVVRDGVPSVSPVSGTMAENASAASAVGPADTAQGNVRFYGSDAEMDIMRRELASERNRLESERLETQRKTLELERAAIEASKSAGMSEAVVKLGEMLQLMQQQIIIQQQALAQGGVSVTAPVTAAAGIASSVSAPVTPQAASVAVSAPSMPAYTPSGQDMSQSSDEMSDLQDDISSRMNTLDSYDMDLESEPDTDENETGFDLESGFDNSFSDFESEYRDEDEDSYDDEYGEDTGDDTDDDLDLFDDSDLDIPDLSEAVDSDDDDEDYDDDEDDEDDFDLDLDDEDTDLPDEEEFEKFLFGDDDDDDEDDDEDGSGLSFNIFDMFEQEADYMEHYNPMDDFMDGEEDILEITIEQLIDYNKNSHKNKPKAG